MKKIAVPIRTAAVEPTVSPHEYRMQLGAYFRAQERGILESHAQAIGKDLEELKAIAAEHNAANEAMRTATEEPPAEGSA